MVTCVWQSHHTHRHHKTYSIHYSTHHRIIWPSSSLVYRFDFQVLWIFYHIFVCCFTWKLLVNNTTHARTCAKCGSHISLTRVREALHEYNVIIWLSAPYTVQLTARAHSKVHLKVHFKLPLKHTWYVFSAIFYGMH